MSNYDRAGSTSDLIAMRRAVATGDSQRVAEMRAQGRGACCEFHAEAEERAHEHSLEIAIAAYKTLLGEDA